jgi:hypothetical protein
MLDDGACWMVWDFGEERFFVDLVVEVVLVVAGDDNVSILYVVVAGFVLGGGLLIFSETLVLPLFFLTVITEDVCGMYCSRSVEEERNVPSL